MINLSCGDCLELLRDVPDGSVDFVLTYVPYGAVNRSDNGLRTLDKGKADVIEFDLLAFLEQCYNKSKNSICVFCGKEQFSTIYAFFANKKGTVRPIVWEKTNPSPMNGEYVYESGVELAVWFKKKGGKVFNAFCKNTVFRHHNVSSKLHPTCKNLKLFEELIADNTNEGDVVLDPCMGSGTTGVACVHLNRKFIGIEKERRFFEVARQRIDDSRGKALF